MRWGEGKGGSSVLLEGLSLREDEGKEGEWWEGIAEEE